MNNLSLRRNRMTSPSIMIAPLVDLIFTLLIFFMLVSTYITPSIKIELPKSSTAVSAERRTVSITITREGALYLEGERLNLQALEQRLKELDPKVVIGVRLRADRLVPLENVVQVLDVVRASPIKSVDIEVRKR